MAETLINNSVWEEYTELETHSGGPHITPLKAENIPILPITTTNFTSIIFLIWVIIFSVMAGKAISKWASKLKTWVLSFVDVTYTFLIESFDWDRTYARKYYPLIMWVFILIFFGNLFWLIIDWLGFSFPAIHYYVRPIFSDLASTLPLAIITVVYSLIIAWRSNGVGPTIKSYAFNWTGDSIPDKAINVFVGWLHFIGVPSTMASLALRLFWNIFAWVILIAVLAYLWTLATESVFGFWVLLTIPFWFFELFVSFVQAAVFAMLMVATFKQAQEH